MRVTTPACPPQQTQLSRCGGRAVIPTDIAS
jgi:hypothetical protein